MARGTEALTRLPDRRRYPLRRLAKMLMLVRARYRSPRCCSRNHCRFCHPPPVLERKDELPSPPLDGALETLPELVSTTEPCRLVPVALKARSLRWYRCRRSSVFWGVPSRSPRPSPMPTPSYTKTSSVLSPPEWPSRQTRRPRSA